MNFPGSAAQLRVVPSSFLHLLWHNSCRALSLPSASQISLKNPIKNLPKAKTELRRLDTLLDSSTLIAILLKLAEKMSTKSKRKSEYEDTPDYDATTTSIPSKRQQHKRKKSNSSKTSPVPKMASAGPTLNVPAAALRTYEQLIPENSQGIHFLFSPNFSEALDTTARRAAAEYQITKEDVLEELRRFLAIKVFTVDEYATKISPTPFSMKITSILLPILNIY